MQIIKAFNKVRELLINHPDGEYSDALLTILGYAEKAHKRKVGKIDQERREIRRLILDAVDSYCKTIE